MTAAACASVCRLDSAPSRPIPCDVPHGPGGARDDAHGSTEHAIAWGHDWYSRRRGGCGAWLVPWSVGHLRECELASGHEGPHRQSSWGASWT